MKFGGLGLRGKFVVALLVAAALPFVSGLLVFETTGFRYLLEERGKLHQLQAQHLVKSLDLAAECQGESLRTWLIADPAVMQFVTQVNQRDASRTPSERTRETQSLDQLWSSLAADHPRLQAVLNNPASNSLRRFQAILPEVAEVLVTDVYGRLVAATGKSSDFDQSDETWWQKGATLRQGTKRTEILGYDLSSAVFSLDETVPLYDGKTFAGVVKMSVDVTSLFANLAVDRVTHGQRWEIVLPDGGILASSKRALVRGQVHLSPGNLALLQRNATQGWVELKDDQGESRIEGFVAMGPPGVPPNAYVLFSSPRENVVGPLRRRFLEIGAVAAGVLMLCAMGGFWLIHRNILQPLAALGRATRAISNTARLHPPGGDDLQQSQMHHAQVEADLAVIQAIRTGDEVEALAADLAVMSARILRYHRELESEVAAKTALIREDLEMAREFQLALMPSRYPEVPAATSHNPLRLRFAHFYQPASTVGGDFFDLLELDEHRAGILIADVMGHGARSALVTAILRALVRNHTAAAADPAAFLTGLNRHLREVIAHSGKTLFVTAFFLVLDTRRGLATWAVAGHPSPLRVRRGSGKPPQPLWTDPPHQPALGLIAEPVFHNNEAPLLAGDVFLLYTDGAVEAENPQGERFGSQRLAVSFDQALDGPMAAMPAKIVCDVTAFQRHQTYEDDVCLVAVEAVSVT